MQERQRIASELRNVQVAAYLATQTFVNLAVSGDGRNLLLWAVHIDGMISTLAEEFASVAP